MRVLYIVSLFIIIVMCATTYGEMVSEKLPFRPIVKRHVPPPPPMSPGHVALNSDVKRKLFFYCHSSYVILLSLQRHDGIRFHKCSRFQGKTAG